MIDLTCHVAGVPFKNPIVMASGTFGFGREYGQRYDISSLGGISGKGLTLNPKAGNEGLRVYETPSGMLNSVGLENPGIPYFLEHECAYWETLDTVRIANLGGNCLDDYVQGALLIQADHDKRVALGQVVIDMIELNISCPNVKEGGIAYGVKTVAAQEVVRLVRQATSLPLTIKLSPNAEDLVGMAFMCEDEGADAISLINTISGMKIDVHRRSSVFRNLYAGLSGPAIKPIALRMVHQVAQHVKIPIMGLGGIVSATDIIEFIMAGASVVQVGTYNFMNLNGGQDLLEGLEQFMLDEKIQSLDEIRGIV
ncbi:dihydroorotate dehydrogenase [Paenibacillus crassostreae]|uniref:Dihydroorotate dehydrogenase n=1 Tax=Paenibacillus crassostreae TaxID=1763538 RepID=A0A167DU26_9BACL|nr:dihydroorotate dehydrogenase [Paenibacillus crassostreae]AOZ91062.1 dihydroorotate dehydrogenase B catalytic subunit [Paenibacillus crassostreae]OAB74776.1 dihydroorotate dehydrogenase [Paenibacillus crassostreae]